MDTMERTILFAVDDDEALPEAMSVVAVYARRWRASVRVLHVAVTDAQNGSARRLVMEVVDRLRGEGIAGDGARCCWPGRYGRRIKYGWRWLHDLRFASEACSAAPVRSGPGAGPGGR